MAVLTVTAPSEVHRSTRYGYIVYQDGVTANVDEGSTIEWTVPDDINPGSYINRAVVLAAGYATIHARDDNNFEEVGYLEITRRVQLISTIVTSTPVRNYYSQATTPTGWLIEWRPTDLMGVEIQGGDIIKFTLPPGDDHATTATADYTVQLKITQRGT